MIAGGGTDPAAHLILSRLHAAVLVLRPDMGFLPRAVVEAVLLSEGAIGTGEALAGHLGMSRFGLARMLRRAGLPPLRRLAGWAQVAGWVIRAEQEGTSLCEMAFQSRRQPGACYRLVREVAGLTWTQLCKRGPLWIERMLIAEMHRVWPRNGARGRIPMRVASHGVARLR